MLQQQQNKKQIIKNKTKLKLVEMLLQLMEAQNTWTNNNKSNNLSTMEMDQECLSGKVWKVALSLHDLPWIFPQVTVLDNN